MTHKPRHPERTAAKLAHLKKIREARARIPKLPAAHHSHLIRMEYLRTRHPDIHAAVKDKEREFWQRLDSESDTGNGMEGLGRFKLAKKLKSINNRLNPMIAINKVLVPKAIQKKSQAFEQHHRTQIKVAGALAATALGAYALAPGLMASAGTSVGTGLSTASSVGKGLALGLAKKLGGDTVADFSADKAIDFTVDKGTDEASGKMADMIKKMGQDKFDEIMGKYQDSDLPPPTDTADPRLQDMTAELTAAATGIDPKTAQASVIQDTKASAPKQATKVLLPIGAGVALLSFLR